MIDEWNVLNDEILQIQDKIFPSQSSYVISDKIIKNLKQKKFYRSIKGKNGTKRIVINKINEI